jgi:MoxR-like ATPase
MNPTFIKGLCEACGKTYKVNREKVPASGKAACQCEAKGTIVFKLEEKPSPEVKPSPEPAPKTVSSVNGGSQTDKVKPKATSAEDQAKVVEIGDAYAAMKREIAKNIVGQHGVVEQLLLGIFAGGHCLLIGVPGLAKTLLVNSLCEALSLEFKRIQFTPDLMPSDITGTEVIQDDPITKERIYKFMPGPIFSNIILADEINRTPPKTQAALLEAMQEKQVSVGGKVHKLGKPFFVIATQNPLDQEGTYPLPEAQQDRFLFNIFVDYPEYEDEITIMKNVTSGVSQKIEPTVSGAQILEYQSLIKRAPVADHVLHYAAKLVRSTRKEKPEAPDFIKNWLSVGAGPRAGLSLISAAKARAILNGNYHVSTEDVAAVANPVLRHRIGVNFSAQAEGITTDIIVEKLLETIPQTI